MLHSREPHPPLPESTSCPTLSAQAIGSLENELVGIRQDMDELIRNMEQ
ncbi:hypothetical protein QQF73_15935 [Marinobacter sp. M216]|uniref:DUF480 domain-containing protein n=2 Tax=Marinobacter TaxID=2742 RepID=A0ABT7HFI1_9GAMM|nr:hypothetical protein [Marinobacter sp. M216]MDK9559124.1 hypothetical protein [Marinobacter sp. M216]